MKAGPREHSDQRPRLRVASYARTSRCAQNVQAQVAQVRQIAAHRNWVIVAEFVDGDVSSRRKHRPEFERMLEAARAAKVDAVVASALDRFARSVRELLDLSDKLQTWGTGMISLREAIDTNTAVGRMTFTVLGAVAELERELIRERTVIGLADARRRGKRLGRPPVPVDVHRALALRDKGASWRQIALKIGCDRRTLQRAIDRHLACEEGGAKRVAATG